MEAKELAAKLHGREYGNITKEDGEEARLNNLVIVYGASDDLMEFRGAIYDEIDAYEGATVKLTKGGLLYAPKDDYCIVKCPYFKEVYNAAKEIKAVWHDEGEPCWTYETKIPHETFDILEDGEVYCEGIVFSIKHVDLPEGVRPGSFATDEDGLVENNFLAYIGDERLMSPETIKKIEQVKGLVKGPELKKLVVELFRIGYGSAVWDHRIGLEDD